MKIEDLHKLFTESEGISTDTRNLGENTLFFALKGDNFNGNQFAEKALNEGCSWAIVEEQEFSSHSNTILVDSVLKTLQDLATFHRQQFNIPVLGITGSNGKTTNKELIGAVLSKKYNLLITEGNLNNHLGVPFTLLRLNKDHEIAIIEMGANKPGDIQELVDIAEPDYGMITNVGAAHIEGFGSFQGVIDTKTEMYRYLGTKSGTIFYNSADQILTKKLPNNTTNIPYGEGSLRVWGELKRLDPFVNFVWCTNGYQSPEIQTNLVGRYNFINFIAAICIGNFFEIAPEHINQALSEYQPSNNRSQVQKTERNTLIVDCYNANPTSMKAALDSFVEMDGVNKLAILGDMLELGDISIEEHQKIADYLNENGISAFLIGSEMAKVNSNLKKFASSQELLESNLLYDIDQTAILLKGSRGIKLETLITHL